MIQILFNLVFLSKRDWKKWKIRYTFCELGIFGMWCSAPQKVLCTYPWSQLTNQLIVQLLNWNSTLSTFGTKRDHDSYNDLDAKPWLCNISFMCTSVQMIFRFVPVFHLKRSFQYPWQCDVTFSISIAYICRSVEFPIRFLILHAFCALKRANKSLRMSFYWW